MKTIKSKTWKYSIIKYTRRDNSYFYDVKYKKLGFVGFFNSWYHQDEESTLESVEEFIKNNVEKDNLKYSQEIIKREIINIP